MAVSLASSGRKGSPSLLTSPTPPHPQELLKSECQAAPQSSSVGGRGRNREGRWGRSISSLVSHGFRWAICSPDTHQRGAGAGGAGLTTFPTRPPPEVNFTLPRRPRQPENQRWKGYCPRGGWVGVGLCHPFPGPCRLFHRSQPLHRFPPLETRFFWSKGALGCHSSQGDPADREGGGYGGGHPQVSPQLRLLGHRGWPTLCRLNIDLVLHPAPTAEA